MRELSSFELAAPLISAAFACGTVNTAGVKNSGDAPDETTSAEAMLGSRRPNEITVCEESKSFFAAIQLATSQARLALAHRLGDVAFIEADDSVEAYTTTRLRYPTMIGHEFTNGLHRVCAATNPPGQLPINITPLTPEEIGNSGLRRALAALKLTDGRSPRHMGTQANGEEVVCTDDVEGLQNKARAIFMEQREGVQIETSEEKKVKYAAAIDRMKSATARAEGEVKFPKMSGVTEGIGEEGTFHCLVAYDSDI